MSACLCSLSSLSGGGALGVLVLVVLRWPASGTHACGECNDGTPRSAKLWLLTPPLWRISINAQRRIHSGDGGWWIVAFLFNRVALGCASRTVRATSAGAPLLSVCVMQAFTAAVGTSATLEGTVYNMMIYVHPLPPHVQRELLVPVLHAWEEVGAANRVAQRPPPPLVASRSSSAVIRGVGQAEEGALLVVPHSSLVLVCASSRLCLNRRPKHSAAP